MAESWRKKQYPRYGQPWNGGELRLLKKLMLSGMHLNEVSHRLERTPESCDAIYREIRRVVLLETGSTTDTLISMKKKPHLARVRKTPEPPSGVTGMKRGDLKITPKDVVHFVGIRCGPKKNDLSLATRQYREVTCKKCIERLLTRKSLPPEARELLGVISK